MARRTVKQRAAAMDLRTGLGGVKVAVYSDDTGTVERGQHDKLYTSESYVKGEHRKVIRVEDLMRRMVRRGTISRDQGSAGRIFRRDFDLANLSPLRAANLESMSMHGGGGEHISTTIAGARNRIHAAMVRLGGHGAPSAEIAWFVLGVGQTIKEHGVREKRAQETASGILIASLGILVSHYREVGQL